MTATVSRSEFVKLVGVFAGSLALGVNLETRASGAVAANGFVPDVWLQIDPNDAVTVTLNKSEMGQGVMTGLPTLIAEELDFPLERLRVTVAEAAPRYIYKGATRMTTGGSTSMRDSWLPLRRAGATARAMLVAAAAKRWSVDPAHLATENGVVVDRATNRRATYGSLATLAATLPVPANVSLKDPSQFKLIGAASTRRLDIPAKVNGTARFGMDVKVPGMHYAAIARSPVFGGKVRSFDAGKAKAIHGVLDAVEVPTGVAVIASNTWAAFQGRNALIVEWDEGPNVQLSSAELFAASERIGSDPAQWKIALQRGHGVDDVHGAKTLEAIYRGPFLAHAAMEPENATAYVHDGICEVWAPTQAQRSARPRPRRLPDYRSRNASSTRRCLAAGSGGVFSRTISRKRSRSPTPSKRR